MALGALAASAATAQRIEAQGSRDSAVARAVASLRDKDHLRVAFLRSRFVGAYMGSRGDTLFFGDAGEPPMAFRFNAVDTIWRARRGTRTGLTIGAVTGAVVGGALVNGTAKTRVTGALGGSVAGGILGALIGRAARHWQRVYP